MIKVMLLLIVIFASCTAAVLKPNEQNIIEGCQSETELWDSVDGTMFFLCIGDNMALKQSCEPNTFFVKNATVSGCIPMNQVDGNCINHAKPKPCEGATIYQPQPHFDPTKFYLCPGSGAELVVLSCPDGKAFVKQNGYLGCFDWEQWRKIRGCDNAKVLE